MHHPSLSWHIIPLKFSSLNIICFCTIFQTLNALKKIHPITHAIFETIRSGFFQILYHCSVSWKINPLYFLAQTPYTLDRNSPSKWNLWTFEWLGENLPNSLLKPQINFSSNFASLFDVMRDKSSVFFYLKLYMIFTKGAHQSAKFQTFDLSGEISPNLNFDRLLLLKAYKISVENLQRSYVSW